MNRKQTFRLVTITGVLFCLVAALGFTLYALKQNINLFYTPTQLEQAHITNQQIVRVGGYVKSGSVHYSPTGESVNFMMTDRKKEIAISYQGVLPNLFREGQAVVVSGKLQGAHALIASEVLAKHDEKYMPPGLAKELNKTGVTHASRTR